MLQQLYAQYAESVQFLLVYIAESHAVDEWPVGETIIKKQHTNTNERIEACQECLDDFGLNWPTVVDDSNNAFHNTYACWPIRFYCIKDDVFEIVATPNCDSGYDLREIETWIKQTVN